MSTEQKKIKEIQELNDETLNEVSGGYIKEKGFNQYYVYDDETNAYLGSETTYDRAEKLDRELNNK